MIMAVIELLFRNKGDIMLRHSLNCQKSMTKKLLKKK